MNRSPFLQAFERLPDKLPLFALAGAVLMPDVQLPLNIFEPRYLELVNDALAADHLIGMVQPSRVTAGLDPNAPPPIHRIGCAGRITAYSESSDGRIMMVLTGLCRFEVTSELPAQRGYRRAIVNWTRFATDYGESDITSDDRSSLIAALKTYCELRRVEAPWDDIADMPDTDLVNLMCTHLPLSPDDKQALVETPALHERARLMRGLLDMASVAGMPVTEQRH